MMERVIVLEEFDAALDRKIKALERIAKSKTVTYSEEAKKEALIKISALKDCYGLARSVTKTLRIS